MPKPILNVSEVEFLPFPAPMPEAVKAKFEGSRLGDIGRRLGAQKLGYNVTLVPPGKRAFPFHNHRINEEMFFVLEGEGEVRIGAERYPIKQGDVIACVPGGPEHAHQIVNTSQADLKYLAVSTKMSPEIAEYPDSGKFGVLAELPPGPDGKPAMFRFMGRMEEQHDYWEGEDAVS